METKISLSQHDLVALLNWELAACNPITVAQTRREFNVV